MIKQIKKMERTNPNYLNEQIEAFDHEQAMQRVAGIQFFKEKDLPKVDKIINILLEIKKERENSSKS